MIKTILFQGDSITDARRQRDDETAYGPGFGYGYAGRIASMLLNRYIDQDLTCINRGISGNRIVDLYARWKIDALNLNPDLISILIGVNDVWHERSNKNGVELPRFEMVYRMLLQWTKEVLPQCRLVLCEPFTLPSETVVDQAFYDDVASYAAVVEKLAKEFDTVFVPLQQVLSDAAKRAGDNKKILIDGVHPAMIGSQIIAEQWMKYVNL